MTLPLPRVCEQGPPYPKRCLESDKNENTCQYSMRKRGTIFTTFDFLGYSQVPQEVPSDPKPHFGVPPSNPKTSRTEGKDRLLDTLRLLPWDRTSKFHVHTSFPGSWRNLKNHLRIRRYSRRQLGLTEKLRSQGLRVEVAGLVVFCEGGVVTQARVHSLRWSFLASDLTC